MEIRLLLKRLRIVRRVASVLLYRAGTNLLGDQMQSAVRNFILGMILLSTCVACGGMVWMGVLEKQKQNKSRPVVQTTVDTTAQAKQASCETENDSSITAGAAVQEREITLQRHSQIVRRLNCDKSVKSEKWEEVVTPNQRILLEASTLADDRKASAKIPIINRTTCDYSNEGLRVLFVVGIFNQVFDGLGASKSAYTAFTVDIAKTAANMRVKEGKNYIDYSFHEPCPKSETNSVETCKVEEQPLLERGVLILDVKYEVKHLEGIKEVDDCEPPKQP